MIVQTRIVLRPMNLPDQLNLVRVQNEICGIDILTIPMFILMTKTVRGSRSEIKQQTGPAIPQMLQAYKVNASGPTIAMLQSNVPSLDILIRTLHLLGKQAMRAITGDLHLSTSMVAPIRLRTETTARVEAEFMHPRQPRAKLRQCHKPCVIHTLNHDFLPCA
ncbi:hypothetical protein Mag101_02530 [Microbulbifer agarilyticus]|uniref:Uncharacterized protein n=1 Tax=Microbulbifer agarilyticus TaxID=260552 RepID=A0A1Q2M331_9GAMM|nr:hypothetical protein Mag101_02530 [Microbulbifer agarilyticus]